MDTEDKSRIRNNISGSYRSLPVTDKILHLALVILIIVSYVLINYSQAGKADSGNSAKIMIMLMAVDLILLVAVFFYAGSRNRKRLLNIEKDLHREEIDEMKHKKKTVMISCRNTFKKLLQGLVLISLCTVFLNYILFFKAVHNGVWEWLTMFGLLNFFALAPLAVQIQGLVVYFKAGIDTIEIDYIYIFIGTRKYGNLIYKISDIEMIDRISWSELYYFPIIFKMKDGRVLRFTNENPRLLLNSIKSAAAGPKVIISRKLLKYIE